MAIKTMEELQIEIGNSNCSGCYLLFSSEFFLIEKMVSKMVDKVLNKELLEFNFSEFDGTDFVADKKNKKKLQALFDNLNDSLNILPVMSEHRVVLIKNLCYVETSKACLKKFEEIITSLPETSIFIITVSTESFDFKKIKEFNVWLNRISKIARIFDCGFRSHRELFEFFAGWVAENGSKISQANFNFLVDRVSKNWQLVFKELEKLCVYAYGREISQNDILKLSAVNLSSTAFELADAILSLKLKEALRIFRNLIELDVNLFLIFGAINTCFVDLYRILVCLQNGLNNSKICEIFNYSEYRIKKIRKFVSRFSLKKVKRCLSVLSKLDLDLKSTAIDKVVLAETAIVEMAGRS